MNSQPNYLLLVCHNAGTYVYQCVACCTFDYATYKAAISRLSIAAQQKNIKNRPVLVVCQKWRSATQFNCSSSSTSRCRQFYRNNKKKPTNVEIKLRQT